MTEAGAIPLVVGLVGHRDLRPEDVPTLRARVGELLDALGAAHPHTPLVLATSLAEGADLLGAELALERGLRLAIFLPFPAEACARDLPDATSRALFTRVLAQAGRVVVCRAPTAPADPPPGDARDQAYARACVELLRHAQVLIALWDGLATHHAAGTARCVDFCLTGVPDLNTQHALAPRTTGTVLHIQTPRISHPEAILPRHLEASHAIWSLPMAAPIPNPLWASAPAALAGCVRMLERLEGFNTAGTDPATTARSETAAQTLLDEPPATSALLARAFGRADALAAHHQRIWHRHLGTLCLLALLAVVLVQCFGNLGGWRGLLIAYLATLLLAALLHLRGRRSGMEERYLDYRCLAEGLRVQFYWRAGGLAEEAADDYLRKQQGDLDWIRHALRAAALFERPRPTDRTTLLRINACWLARQAEYFGQPGQGGRADTHLAAAGRLARLARAAYLAAVLLAVVQLALPAHGLLITLMSLGPALYGLISLYGEKRCLSDQAREYAQAGLLFRVARQRMAEALAQADPLPAQLLLREAGRLALDENGDWLLTHRKRPAEFIPV